MEHRRVIILNARQIAELLHDYVAENATSICLDKKVIATTYTLFNKDSAKMLGAFSTKHINLINENSLLEKLPYTGFKNIILTNKQLKQLIDADSAIEHNNICWGQEDRYKSIKKNQIRFIVWKKEEILSALYKQFFHVFYDQYPIDTTNFEAKIKIVFDGEHSKLICLFSNCVENTDLKKLNLENFETLDSWGWKQSILTKEEYENFLKINF